MKLHITDIPEDLLTEPELLLQVIYEGLNDTLNTSSSLPDSLTDELLESVSDILAYFNTRFTVSLARTKIDSDS